MNNTNIRIHIEQMAEPDCALTFMFQQLARRDKWEIIRLTIDYRRIEINMCDKTNRKCVEQIEMKSNGRVGTKKLLRQLPDVRELDVKEVWDENEDEDDMENDMENDMEYEDDMWDELLDNLPPCLEKLRAKADYSRFSNLPLGIRVLEVYGELKHTLDQLPQSLVTLRIECCEVTLDDLPAGLQNLVLGKYSGDLQCLPSGLKFLHLMLKFPHPASRIVLPQTIQCVRIAREYNRNLSVKLRKKYGVCVVYGYTEYEKQVETFNSRPKDRGY